MITNPFHINQEVVCISEDFPWIKEYGGSGKDYPTPKKGEVIEVDEILGEFVRFDKYDTDEACNWWLWDRFAPIESMGNYLELEEAIVETLEA